MVFDVALPGWVGRDEVVTRDEPELEFGLSYIRNALLPLFPPRFKLSNFISTV
jgi:hypothetical protein